VTVDVDPPTSFVLDGTVAFREFIGGTTIEIPGPSGRVAIVLYP
jgi:hypothetical protein